MLFLFSLLKPVSERTKNKTCMSVYSQPITEQQNVGCPTAGSAKVQGCCTVQLHLFLSARVSGFLCMREFRSKMLLKKSICDRRKERSQYKAKETRVWLGCCGPVILSISLKSYRLMTPLFILFFFFSLTGTLGEAHKLYESKYEETWHLMPSATPARLLVSVFLLMFLILNHLSVHSLCQDYFEVIAILSMSVQNLLLLRGFMTILSLPCRNKVIEEGGRDHR